MIGPNYEDEDTSLSASAHEAIPQAQEGGEAAARFLLQKAFLISQLFAMDESTDAHSHHHQQQSLPLSLDHIACCALEMLTILFCITLLRHLISFDVFKSSGTAAISLEAKTSFGGHQRRRASEKSGIQQSRGRIDPRKAEEEETDDETEISTDDDDDDAVSDSSSSWQGSRCNSESPSGSSRKFPQAQVSSSSSSENEESCREEDEEEDDRLTSSVGNFSFNSNHVEISTCYESDIPSYEDEEEDDSCSSSSPSSSSPPPLEDTSRSNLDFPSPLIDADEDDEDDASSCASSNRSIESSCSWYQEHYGSIINKTRPPQDDEWTEKR